MTVLRPGDRVVSSDQVSSSDRILGNPRFQELVRTRSSFGWTLSFVMLGIYLAFILLVAFDYKLNLMGTKVAGTTSLGIVLGLLVILSAIALTGIYIARANGRYDALTRDVMRELG